jgi:hypothetical protein
MQRADRRERYGAKYLELLPQGESWPGRRLPISMPQLCLAGVLRLRAALERIVARHPDPRRVAQLKVVVRLEDGLRGLARDLAQHRSTAAAAVAAVDELFFEAEDVIDGDLADIFEEAESAGDVPRRAA